MKSLILAGLSVPALVTSLHGDPRGLHGALRAHLHGVISQRLELTAEQKEAIQRIVQSHHPALHAKARAAFSGRADVLQALTDPHTTEGQIRELEARASAASLSLDLEINQVFREITPLLTEAQRAKGQQLIAEFRAHIEGFFAAAHGAKG